MDEGEEDEDEERDGDVGECYRGRCGAEMEAETTGYDEEGVAEGCQGGVEAGEFGVQGCEGFCWEDGEEEEWEDGEEGEDLVGGVEGFGLWSC